MAGLGSNCLLRPERWPQMRVAAESLAIYTAAVVGSSPAGPTHITAAQSSELRAIQPQQRPASSFEAGRCWGLVSGCCQVLRLSSTQSAAASNARATDRACTGVRNSA